MFQGCKKENQTWDVKATNNVSVRQKSTQKYLITIRFNTSRTPNYKD
jgi:hypothetical protein